MKKKTYRILIVIIFLAGLSLLLYPFVANQWNNYRQKQLISDYDSIVSAEDAAGEIDYAAELENKHGQTMKHYHRASGQTPWPLQRRRKGKTKLTWIV